MEERMSMRDAFGTAWGNLTGVNSESSSVRSIRLVFFLIFLAGTGWAGYNYFKYYTAREELEYKVYTPSARSAAPAEADKKRLNAMVEEVRLTTERRKNSTVMAGTVRNMGFYPFGDPLLAPPPGDIRDVPEIVLPPVPEPVEMPPSIVLRAIMVIGKQQVAVMDIAGVGSGMIVKAGDTFMQNKGRVVRITPDKVVIRWAGKNFDIRPNF